MRSLFQSTSWIARHWRAAFTTNAPSLPPSGVLLHDPAASRPHDLDDPFFDPKVQKRVADLIAGAVRKKP